MRREREYRGYRGRGFKDLGDVWREGSEELDGDDRWGCLVLVLVLGLRER